MLGFSLSRLQVRAPGSGVGRAFGGCGTEWSIWGAFAGGKSGPWDKLTVPSSQGWN